MYAVCMCGWVGTDRHTEEEVLRDTFAHDMECTYQERADV